MTYRIEYSPAARRALTHDVPESVAAAAYEFIESAVAETPHRVGTALRGPLAGLHSARRGVYRLIYEINDDRVIMRMVRVPHRRSAYRP